MGFEREHSFENGSAVNAPENEESIDKFPDSILSTILSFIEIKDILNASLVSKRWNTLTKSHELWSIKYIRRFNQAPKKLPWYVFYALFSTDYFDTNLLKNGNGQEGFQHWNILKNGGDEFQIEKSPVYAHPLPQNVAEFNGHSSCFVTSYGTCSKCQIVSFEHSPLMRRIFAEFKPHIYGSEWVAGRSDCGCKYKLSCSIYTNNDNTGLIESEETYYEGNGNSEWIKKEVLIKNYTKSFSFINFYHEGVDARFWAGHYGSKMAGGVLKILFDSIEPL